MICSGCGELGWDLLVKAAYVDSGRLPPDALQCRNGAEHHLEIVGMVEVP